MPTLPLAESYDLFGDGFDCPELHGSGSDDYRNLHAHGPYSTLDGHALLPEYVAKAKLLGHTQLALTDHGTMAGIAAFHTECLKAGITPICGMEAYVAPSGRHVRNVKAQERFHLTLLAMNRTGYKNLMHLATHAATDGYYYRARIDHDLLATHHEGLVCLSGCLGAELPKFLMDDQANAVDKTIAFYHDLFGERYFLEIQNHGALLPQQQRVNRELLALANKRGIPLVATNDSHFCEHTEADAHQLLVSVNTGQRRQGGGHVSGSPYTYYRTNEQMGLAFGPGPWLTNSLLIGSWIEDFPLGDPVPKLPISPLETSLPPLDRLKQLAWFGLKQRFSAATVPDSYTERLKTEIEVVAEMSAKLGAEFGRYILLVADIARYCRDHGIRFGPRGSAAGSVICWALGISEPDPIAEGLLFERFLNPHRIELPDIDVDIADDRRDEVLQYLVNTYGADRVARIGTYNALGAKDSLKRAAKAIQDEVSEPYLQLGNRLARMVPPDQGTIPPHKKFDIMLTDKDSELANAYRTDANVTKVVDAARQIAGRYSGSSTHAAGIVITDRPVVDLVPIMRSNDDTIPVQTQYELPFLEPMGVLKMDLLGLSTLATIDEALKMVATTTGQTLDPWTFALDDPAAWACIHQGRTLALFQLGSRAMTRAIVSLAPQNISELALAVAIFRPGPLQNLEEIVERRHGRNPVTYLHPSLEPILHDTYGFPVFQEQVMKICQVVAGYSLPEADLVRKAMGKKKPEILAKEGRRFHEQAVQRGYLDSEAQAIWAYLLPFAEYGFNKAHATCYAYLAYQSAWLKATYPLQFYAAALTVESRTGSHGYETSQHRIGALAWEARQNGIEILPPDVRASQVAFAPEGDQMIRYGLGSIKGVGRDAENIIKARTKRSFADLSDFLTRTKLNKVKLEAVIRVGALPWGDRCQLLANLDSMAKSSKGQLMLGGFDDGTIMLTNPPVPDESIQWEEDLLGLFTTPLPLIKNVPLTCTIGELTDEEDLIGRHVTLYGMLGPFTPIVTRKGQKMAFGLLSDGTARVQLTFFPRLWAEIESRGFKPTQLVIASGKLEDRGDRGLSVLVDNLMQAEVERPVAPPKTTIAMREVRLSVPVTTDPKAALEVLTEAIDVLRTYPGAIRASICYGSSTEICPVNEDGVARLIALGAISR